MSNIGWCVEKDDWNTGGEAALEQFKRIRQDLPVVLMTGYGEVEAAQRFVGKELAGFIQKPFTVQKLLGAVSSALNALKKEREGELRIAGQKAFLPRKILKLSCARPLNCNERENLRDLLDSWSQIKVGR